MTNKTTYVQGDYSDEDIQHRTNLDGLMRYPRPDHRLDYVKGHLFMYHNNEQLFRLKLIEKKLFFYCHEKFLQSMIHIVKQLTMNGQNNRAIQVCQNPDTKECLVVLRQSDKKRLLFLLGEELGFPLGWDPDAKDNNVYTYCQEHNIDEQELERLSKIESIVETSFEDMMLEPAPWTTR